MVEEKDIYQFGFSSAWLADSKYEETLSSPLTQELIPIATAFKDNIIRHRSLGALVPDIAYWTRVYAKFGDVARYRLGLPIGIPGRVRGAVPLDQQILDEVAKVKQEWRAALPVDGNIASSQAWEDGSDLVKSLVNSFPDSALGSGIEVLMSAELIELWAAVEALLEDTWVTAVNLVPDPLASNILRNEKNFSFDIIKQASFDLSKSMGTIMVRHNKVNMNSLSGIKKAYLGAFSDQNPGELFENYDPDIAHLEAIRNLFAHRSGIIDQKFLDKIKKSNIITGYKIGDRLKLNGNIVSFYTGRCIEFAVSAFVFVDRWIFSSRNHE